MVLFKLCVRVVCIAMMYLMTHVCCLCNETVITSFKDLKKSNVKTFTIAE